MRWVMLSTIDSRLSKIRLYCQILTTNLAVFWTKQAACHGFIWFGFHRQHQISNKKKSMGLVGFFLFWLVIKFNIKVSYIEWIGMEFDIHVLSPKKTSSHRRNIHNFQSLSYRYKTRFKNYCDDTVNCIKYVVQLQILSFYMLVIFGFSHVLVES